MSVDRTSDLDATRRAIVSTANHFRLGMDTQANTTLVELVDGLQRLLATDTVACGADLDVLLGLVVDAQTRGDVLRIADLLEYELLPLLEVRAA